MAFDDVQFIPASGEPQWAIMPYQAYIKLTQAAPATMLVPDALARRMLAGENTIRVWREYRGLTQQALAKAAGISVPYLSQLEKGLRTGSKQVLLQLAHALAIPLDLLCK